MDARARVEAALAGDRVDRVPVGAWGHSYREEWSPEDLARVTVERARRAGFDFVKFQPRATVFAEAFGNRYRPSNHRLKGPVLLEVAVPDLAAWPGLGLVAEGVLEEQVRSLGLVVRELGERVPVLQTVFSPVSVADYLVGRDKRRVGRELRAHPEVVLPALERIAEVLAGFARRSVEAGAAGIFYAVSGFATRDTMPIADYERLLLPMDRRLLESLPKAAWFNVLHLCGSHINLGVGRRLPVQAVSWSIHNQGNPSLAEGRELTGRAVMGGLAQRGALLNGPESEIAAQARAAVAATGGRHLLLAPGCSVPPRARESHLNAMVAGAS